MSVRMESERSPSGVLARARRVGSGRDNKDHTAQVYDSVIANEYDYAPRARNLPERPEPSEGIEAYSTWLDSMCAHVRAMAQRAAAEYHRERLEHHRERLVELERAA